MTIAVVKADNSWFRAPSDYTLRTGETTRPMPPNTLFSPVPDGGTGWDEGLTGQALTDAVDYHRKCVKKFGNDACRDKYFSNIENDYVRLEKLHKQLEAAGHYNKNQSPTTDDRPQKQRSADTWELLNDELVRVGGTMDDLVNSIRGNADSDVTNYMKPIADFRRKFTLAVAAATDKQGLDDALATLKTDLATVADRD